MFVLIFGLSLLKIDKASREFFKFLGHGLALLTIIICHCIGPTMTFDTSMTHIISWILSKRDYSKSSCFLLSGFILLTSHQNASYKIQPR